MFHLNQPVNEVIKSYDPQTLDREILKAELERQSHQRVDIPCIIGGKRIFTGRKRQVVMPHDHHHVLADFHMAGETELELAVEASRKAKAEWESLSWSDRAAVFLKAADILAGSYRYTLNAATMLGQSKNAFQAEIDSACELIDFLRFNAYFYQQILHDQPISSPGMWNRSEYRALEGFVLAITPFNFTAIAGNLPATPAMLGNTVIWKPSDTQMLSAYYTMLLFEEAGLPPGVINFLGADGPLTSQCLLKQRDLAGVHFTGSSATFNSLWKSLGENLDLYRGYPRLVGETGGKDFIFAHPSADHKALITALVRGAYEYQGQKCSAASRAYIPKSVWLKIEEQLISEIQSISVGDVRDFRNFMNAVIDERSFNKISGYIQHAHTSHEARVRVGGECIGDQGYFIRPTLIQADSPQYRSMTEEIFGPVLSVHVYEDQVWREMLKICDQSSPYALTGAIFAQDRLVIEQMSKELRHSAGNFYINDKPTGAVVAQQPFGGARRSGTNDKAGSKLNLYRWISPRSIKETFYPPREYRYSFMKE